jgi:sulfonate transport system substrate-binding protein
MMPSAATRRQFIQHLIGVPAALTLAGGGAAFGAGRTLRFSYQRSSTLLTILKTNKTLEQRLGAKGYDVSWHLFTNVIEPMNAGSVDFHADVADAVPIFTQASGAQLTIYAKEDASPQAEAIIVHEDSPVKTLADLKGKKIGVHKGSGCHFLLTAALKSVGLSFKDITPVYIEPINGAPAFSGRDVDAWVIWDPFLAITQSRSPVRVIHDASGFSGYCRYYLVNDGFVIEHPEIVRIVFDALAETGRWVKSNPQAAAKLLAPLWGDIPVSTIEVVNSRRSYAVEPVERTALEEQQKIADTFFEARLIPRSIKTADAPIWNPDSGRS